MIPRAPDLGDVVLEAVDVQELAVTVDQVIAELLKAVPTPS